MRKFLVGAFGGSLWWEPSTHHILTALSTSPVFRFNAVHDAVHVASKGTRLQAGDAMAFQATKEVVTGTGRLSDYRSHSRKVNSTLSFGVSSTVSTK